MSLKVKYIHILILATAGILYEFTRTLFYYSKTGFIGFHLNSNLFYYALIHNILFMLVVLFGFYIYLKKKVIDYEPLAILAFISIFLNYYYLKLVSTPFVEFIGYQPYMHHPFTRGDGLILSIYCFLINLTLGLTAKQKIKINSKEGSFIANFSTTIGSVGLVCVIVFYIGFLLLLSGLSAFP